MWQELLPDLPPEATSFAVDLIPDLDGTPDQQLTHDFTDSAAAPDDDRGVLPYALGGVLALVAGIAFVRMVHKRA